MGEAVERTPTPCVVCGKLASTVCGKCKVEKYCGRDCQVSHWKVHKTVCKAPSSSSSSKPGPPPKPLCGKGYHQWISALSGSWQKSGPQFIQKPTVGLQNQENTCYLNAVLQCLLHTTLLRECVTQACPSPRKNEEWLSELVQLFREVDEARGARRSLSASGIAGLITKNNGKEFARGRQADAHEALMLILSRLLDECLAVGDGSGQPLKGAKYSTKEQLERSSLIGHVFGMDMGQTVRCDSCSYESTSARVEYCCCLSCTLGMSTSELLALHEELQRAHLTSSFHRSAGAPQESSAPETNVESLLEEYMKSEHIEGYKCDKCKKLGCTRSAYLARRPNVLVVYIDRRQDTGLFTKVNRRVRFQQKLELSPFLDSGVSGDGSSSIYSLYALIVHKDVNRSTFFGHYVAYVRDKTSQWYVLDDTRVEPVPWSLVQEQHAYLLFYSADSVLSPQIPAEASTADGEEPAVQSTVEPGSGVSSTSTASTAASSASSPRSSSATSTSSTSAPAVAPATTAAVEEASSPHAQAEQPAPSGEEEHSPVEGGSPAEEETGIESLGDILAKLDQDEAREQVKEAELLEKHDEKNTSASRLAEEEVREHAQEEKRNSLFDFDALDELDEMDT